MKTKAYLFLFFVLWSHAAFSCGATYNLLAAVILDDLSEAQAALDQGLDLPTRIEAFIEAAHSDRHKMWH